MAPDDELVWRAQGDAWQAQGRLRADRGGGAAELPGVRVMASGLPFAFWNSGDVFDAAAIDLDAVRAWHAQRAFGAGVPWGLRVPAGAHFQHGRLRLRKRCMGLLRAAFQPVPAPSGVTIEAAVAADAHRVAGIDAAAFAEPEERSRPWVEPTVGAAGFTVALARLGAEPVGVATAIATHDRAGPSVGIFGVAVLDAARRRGIGAAITSWLLDRAFAVGAMLAHLNPDSDEAARLYARLGFVETGGLDIYGDF